uniref:Uncharacterized protein n=1 Tax=Candidatus Kentrum sp. FW TaxID=2126338 RepID=A0A450U4F8_9GAMM|nr:MAG: hypothetical protein BECKFW1821C_GA0114237_11873 [Candidatus Kentron sp. FW]
MYGSGKPGRELYGKRLEILNSGFIFTNRSSLTGADPRAQLVSEVELKSRVVPERSRGGGCANCYFRSFLSSCLGTQSLETPLSPYLPPSTGFLVVILVSLALVPRGYNRSFRKQELNGEQRKYEQEVDG